MKGVAGLPGLIRPVMTPALMERALRWLYATLQAHRAFPGLRFPRPLWFVHRVPPSLN